MRIVSQDGTKNLNYDRCAIYIEEYRQVKYQLVAYCGEKNIVIGTYDTFELAELAFNYVLKKASYFSNGAYIKVPREYELKRGIENEKD